MKQQNNHAKGACLVSAFKFKDKISGDRIEISSTPHYTILKVNNKYYYFNSESGEYDGTSQDIEYFEN